MTARLKPHPEPHGDFLTVESGRVAFTKEVALVYAEELVAFEYDRVPRRRVADQDIEASLRSRPIAVVLDEARDEDELRPEPSVGHGAA